MKTEVYRVVYRMFKTDDVFNGKPKYAYKLLLFENIVGGRMKMIGAAPIGIGHGNWKIDSNAYATVDVEMFEKLSTLMLTKDKVMHEMALAIFNKYLEDEK